MAMGTVFSAIEPPLENGDRLSQPEFHRRYELHPELHHVELIEGVVYMPSIDLGAKLHAYQRIGGS